MQTIVTIDDALRVLGQVQHRGVRTWLLDPQYQRVMPEHWTERDPCPTFTKWEALTIAGRLVQIGALPRRPARLDSRRRTA